ncbi:retrovirus-related pol polyprotein from transposon TNT 1-94, partial [Tanacetum coccineum]
MRLIQSLASKELVRNLPKLKFDQHFCDACKIGKQAHVSHKAKNIVSTTRCLELLHMDLFGPSAVRSYGGNRYTLVIVDDYSRKPTLDYFRVFGSKCFILNTKDYLTKFDPKSYEGVFLGYSQNSKAYIILNKHTRKIEESLNVTFDETPPPSKTSPLVDDDLDEEEAIREIEKKNLENVVEDETLEIDEIVNIKESRNHPLENVIGNLNQRTLRSQAQNQSNFYCFISTIEPKNVNEALGDESWIVAMQEELNQFIANDVWELVPQPKNMTIIGTKWVFRSNKIEGKDNGENIMSHLRRTIFIWERSQMLLLGGTEGAVQQGPGESTYYSIHYTVAKTFRKREDDLEGFLELTKDDWESQFTMNLNTSSKSKEKNHFRILHGEVMVQDVRGRYNANNQGRPFQRNNARGNGVAENVGGQNRGGIINPGQDATNAAKRSGASTGLKNSLVLAGEQVVQVVLWYLDSGCSKHMTGNRSKLKNFVEKFIGTVRFGNDHFGAIMGYGDYVIGDSVISRVYYVEGLGHNLFSVGQFCDSDLEIAFRKHSCFVRDMNGVDLLKGSRSTNLYTISIDDMMKSSPVCLLSKASKTKSWLWHRRLNHLNFGTINDLARKDLVRGLPRLKFEKDHLCSACQLGKSKKYSHKPKSENTNMEVLHTLHMDLCGPMRDETPEFVINFLKQIQVGLNKIVRYIRTDNGTEFVNQVMSKYYEGVGIFHQKSVPRTPQQNGVVERRNRTLMEAARTMLIFSTALMFLWAEAVATACYTQNRSLIHTPHNKTPYELVHDKKPDLTFLRVFSAMCYPTNDSEDLGKLQAKADIGIFVGYVPSRKGYKVYNKRTRRIMETIHVTFDELHQTMDPVRISSKPEPIMMTPGQVNSGLAPTHVHATTYVPPTDKELEILFQPMLDEYFEQSRVNEQVPPATAVNAHVVPPGTSLSTTFAQDAPSTSVSPSSSDM